MPIQVLPPQLANQIAAGEVVERPASVVKELVENSLDAGATRIDIDIDRGGAKMIRIRDNGCGISKEELALALARHATSKIASLEDLEAIISLGFRGEALASISSVSRLIMTSRTESQPEAWQAYAEGRDMAVTVKPAAHPVGTTVEVLDLFYNTPARRKFLRTEKTEFGHIDEVIRRIALARFDVAINLSHNGKLVRQYRPAPERSQHERRLASICGTQFLSHALAISWQHGDLSIDGWVADPAGSKMVGELQYCYVNGRMMRDRLINHAIRQAYQTQLSGDQQPAYVLYLTVDPHQVDVNVHPAKHEVRFHQSRLVHDFIYQAVVSVLQQAGTPSLSLDEGDNASTQWQPENRVAAGENIFNQPAESLTSPNAEKTVLDPFRQKESKSYSGAGSSQGAKQAREADSVGKYPPRIPENTYQKQQGELYQKFLQPASEEGKRLQESTMGKAVEQAASVSASPLSDSAEQSFGRVLTVLKAEFAVLEFRDGLALLVLPVAERWLRQAQLTPGSEGLRAQPLLIPLQVSLDENACAAFQAHQSLLESLGLQISLERRRATVRAVPLPLRQQNLQRLIPELMGYLAQSKEVSLDIVTTWLARHLGSEHTQWNQSQAIQLLADVERLCPNLVKSPPAGLLQPLDLQAAISILKA